MSPIEMRVAVVDEKGMVGEIQKLRREIRWTALGLAVLGVGLLVTMLTGCGEPQDIPFPKRYVSLNLAHRQPMEWWRSVDGIYGMQEAGQVIAKRAQLTKEENERLRVYCTLMPTVTFGHPLEGWEEGIAADNPMFAAFVMVRRNLDAGADWYLYTSLGQRAGKWNRTLKALDLSDHCPKGVYGSSAGLTARQWLLGPYLKLLQDSRFGDAFDGVILEDGPEKGLWHYEWDWIRLGGVDVNRATYIAEMDTCYVEYLKEFIGQMRRDYVVLINGHHTPGGPADSEQIRQAFAGCKIECMGKWGGWPEGNLAQWWEAYKNVERLYWYGREPRAGKKRDRLLGWDVSIAQIEIDTTMTIKGAHRWQRLMVGMTLMGDASYSISWEHDHHGGEPSQKWIAPELGIRLGYPTGPWEGTPDSLLWRRFADSDGVKRQVTVNLSDRWIGGVRARDATWEVVK